MNIGHSSRLPYDDCAYPDRLLESTNPLKYRLSQDQMYNCRGCLSTLGPRASYNGVGVSTNVGNVVAPAQALIDVDSLLSNRSIRTSKCKTGNVNNIDMKKFNRVSVPICNDYLNPEYSRLSYPSSNYRELPLNRFYNLPKDPQLPIFWDFAVNSTLEMTDNYDPDIPTPLSQYSALPREDIGKIGQCGKGCISNGATCPVTKPYRR